MEIVSEPQMHTGLQAGSMVAELRRILQCLGTCDGKMEGQYANLSWGAAPFWISTVGRNLEINRHCSEMHEKHDIWPCALTCFLSM